MTTYHETCRLVCECHVLINIRLARYGCEVNNAQHAAGYVDVEATAMSMRYGHGLALPRETRACTRIKLSHIAYSPPSNRQTSGK